MNGLSRSAGGVPASTPGTNGPRALPMRDGSATLAQAIDVYMAVYDGRDTTRPQRLGLWRDRLGGVSKYTLNWFIEQSRMAQRTVQEWPSVMQKNIVIGSATLPRLGSARQRLSDEETVSSNKVRAGKVKQSWDR
jgi:hypothetical protein